MGVIPTIWNYLAVLGLSAIPIIEVKGAITLGYLTFGIPLWECFLLAIIGAILPAPFVILLFRKILHALEKSRFKIFRQYGAWLQRRTEKKGQGIKLRGYSLFALFIFVAIPLPTTGVWSGSMIAGFLDLRLKPSLIVIFLGNVIASLCILALNGLITI